MVQPKLVIFDMDGTMLDTERLSLAGMIEASRVMGYETTREFYEEIIGRNAAYARKLAIERYGQDFDFERAHAIHLEYIDTHFEKYGVPIKPGLIAMLDRLEALGIKKCVATSTAKARATHKLTLANLAHRFEVIVGGDEVAESKPNPEIFLKAAESCGVDPAECLVLEDSPAGAEAAARAGMPTILVPDIAPLTEETRAKAVAVCADLLEATELLSAMADSTAPSSL